MEIIELILLLALFVFLFSIFKVALYLYFEGKKISHSMDSIIALSIAALIIYIIKFTVLGEFLLKILLPFIILSIFLLVLFYIFMQAIGIKFGDKENENSFISVVTTIVMWVGAAILIISFLAALKKMGYSFIDRMLDPTVFGVLFFFLIIFFMLNSLEEEKKSK